MVEILRMTSNMLASGLPKAAARVVRLLRSPKLAVILLGLFVLACLLGNLVPQVGTAGVEAVEKWQAAHPLAGRLLAPLDGFRVFRAGWFLLLSSLLALCTLVCTIDQLPRAARGTLARPLSASGFATAHEIRLPLPPEEALRAVCDVFRRLGLRTRREGDRLYGERALGRWSSPLFHLGLVLLFLSITPGALLRWTMPIILAEGDSFDPRRQPVHGLRRSLFARPPETGELPQVTLEKHYPRYRMKSYSPDSASRLIIDGRPVLVRYGTPLPVRRLTLRQERRYGALAEAVLRRRGEIPPAVRRTAEGPPPFGGFFTSPDGTYRAGLVFVSQADAEKQRRSLELPETSVVATFRLLPGPEGARYELPLDRRFELVVSLSGSDRSILAGERTLRVGETLEVGPWLLEFRSLRYWSAFTLTAAPLTPAFFALAWWCVLALGLGVLFPVRRAEAELAADETAGGRPGTLVRYWTGAGRGDWYFPDRLAEALRRLEEENG